jgi:hypothetical protein
MEAKGCEVLRSRFPYGILKDGTSPKAGLMAKVVAEADDRR